MSNLPLRIQELISTPTRKEIFKTIKLQKDGFSFQDLYSALEEKKVNVSITSVQNMLKALYYRGYLKEIAIKDNKKRGRSIIHYKKLF